MVEIKSSDILCAEQLNKNIRVFAGPGAGKTHFLVENIKNAISTNAIITGSKSRKILCITYTNAAVDEIKRRLDRFMDSADIYTIHGFIIDNIIKPFQEDLRNIMKSDFGIEIKSTGTISSQIEGLGILHGIDKEDMFSFIMKKSSSTSEITYSKKIMGEVEIDCKSFVSSVLQGDSPIRQLKSSKSIKEEHRLPIKEYVWSKVRKVTHDEILYFGYRILETNPLALYYLRVRYPFIFVDEFQDTNPIQTLLIKLICQKSSHVCVVGDVAQSIYSFQGASPSDFEKFHIDEDDIDFAIIGNRRSSANIVNFCNFIRQVDTAVVQNSLNNQTQDNKVHFLLGHSENIKSIIRSVLCDKGVVLTRTWATAFQYIDGIEPPQSELLKRIYNHYYNTPISIRDEIVELNNVLWVRAFKFIFRLYESYKSGSLIDVISAFSLYERVQYQKITPKILILLRNLLELIFDKCDKSTAYEIIIKFNSEITKESYKILNELVETGTIEVTIFDEIEKEEFKNDIKELQWTTAYKLFNEVFTDNSKYLTVHQAKGLEWNQVIVATMPSRNDKIKISDLYASPQILGDNVANEFVRIYYVACSRAINDLYLHIPEGCTRTEIETSLNKFIKKSGLALNYEFIE